MNVSKIVVLLFVGFCNAHADNFVLKKRARRNNSGHSEGFTEAINSQVKPFSEENCENISGIVDAEKPLLDFNCLVFHLKQATKRNSL